MRKFVKILHSGKTVLDFTNLTSFSAKTKVKSLDNLRLPVLTKVSELAMLYRVVLLEVSLVEDLSEVRVDLEVVIGFWEGTLELAPETLNISKRFRISRISQLYDDKVQTNYCVQFSSN